MGAIGDRLLAVRGSIPQGTELVAVSKFHPVEELMEAYQAGQRLFGENRPQEMAAKAVAMPKDIQWHFIGHLQSNKIKQVVPYATLIHSVDSEKLYFQIKDYCVRNSCRARVLLQMHIASEDTKQGFSAEELLAFVSTLMGGVKIDEPSPVEICGLMGMASFTDDVSVVDGEFSRIEQVFRQIKAQWGEGMPAFRELSIGMSGDYMTALRHGATLVRVGTAIFGERDYSKPFKIW